MEKIMNERTISSKEIVDRRTVQATTEVSLLAKQRVIKQNEKMDVVNVLIRERYTGDIDLQIEDEVKLTRSVIMGVLHATGEAELEFAGTVSQVKAIEHMGSSFRPVNHYDSDYMFQAVTDPLIVEVGGKPVLRHELKTDLTNVFRDFHLIRKEASEIEAAYTLFSNHDEVEA